MTYLTPNIQNNEGLSPSLVSPEDFRFVHGKEYLVSSSWLSGEQIFVSKDEVSKEYVIRRKQNYTPVLANNYAQQTQEDNQSKRFNLNAEVFHKKVASIPLSVYLDLEAKGIFDDEVEFKKWFNHPDNWLFRTTRASL